MTFQAYLDTVRAKTGLGPEDFRALAAAKGLTDAKAGVIGQWLKAEYGLGQGHAMAIWMVIKTPPGEPLFRPADERMEALFSGGRAIWRATFDDLLALAKSWGEDVGASPAAKYVSLTRGRTKFAILQPGASHLDLGFKRRGVAETARFASAAGWNDMVSHRTRIASRDEVDAEVRDWLRASYDAAG